VPTRNRLAAILVAAFAFGVVAAVAKGQNTDGIATMSQVRGVLGNLSTPWLLVPFVAGTQCFRLRAGAVVGLFATLAALCGFYLLTTFVIDLGGHGVAGDLRLEFTGNRVYFEGGLISGPLFGSLGAWWQRERKVPVSIVAGALLMAEPIVLGLSGAFGPNRVSDGGVPLLFRMVWGWGLGQDSGAIALGVYAAEFAIGLAVVLLVAWRHHRPPAHAA